MLGFWSGFYTGIWGNNPITCHYYSSRNYLSKRTCYIIVHYVFLFSYNSLAWQAKIIKTFMLFFFNFNTLLLDNPLIAPLLPWQFITAKSTFDFAQWDEVDFWKQFCSCYIFNNNYFVKNYSNRIRMEIVKYTYRLLLHCS